MTVDREAMKEALLKRTQASAENTGGGANYKYFNTDVELPFFTLTPTKGDPNIIDIIPFKAGDNFPLEKGRKAVKKGDDTYVLRVKVHTNVGAAKEMILCPQANYGKPCPICEDVVKRQNEGAEWDEVKTLVPKERCVYNIVHMNTDKTEAKGVQIWEAPYGFSEKEITAQAKNVRGGGGYIPFSFIGKELGKSIQFEVDSDKYRTTSGFKLLDRDYDIPDRILDQVFTLDELIIVHSYETIKKKYLMTEGEETAKDDVPSHMPSAEAPQTSRRAPRGELAGCPAGGVFGIDINKLPGCQTCPDTKYNLCADEADHLEAEAKVAEEKRKAEEAAKKSGTEGLQRRRRTV